MAFIIHYMQCVQVIHCSAKMYSTRVNLFPCTSVSRASATTVLATKPPQNRSSLSQRRISNAHCIYVMIKYKNAKMISCFLSYVHECEEGNGELVCFYVMVCLQWWACHINGSAQDCSFVLNHYISEAVSKNQTYVTYLAPMYILYGSTIWLCLLWCMLLVHWTKLSTFCRHFQMYFC